MIQKSEQDIMQHWGEKTASIVSICCITYNHENYITDTLDGFMMQETDFPFEVIVRDDCSTDTTAEIIREYERKYPSIIKPIYEQENQFSQGKRAFPVVIKAATGKYIAFCEGDDYWTDPQKLQKQVDFLEKNDDYVLTYHGAKVVDEHNKVIHNQKGDKYQDYDCDEMLCGIANIPTLSSLFRNVAIDYEYFIRKQTGGDTATWHLLGYHGKSKFMPDIAYGAYREHGGGIYSKINRSIKLTMFLNEREAICNSLIDHQKPELVKRVNDLILPVAVYHLRMAIQGRDGKTILALLKIIGNHKNISFLSLFLRLIKSYVGIFIRKLLNKKSKNV